MSVFSMIYVKKSIKPFFRPKVISFSVYFFEISHFIYTFVAKY